MTRKRDRPYGLDVTPINPLNDLFHDEAIAAAEFVAIADIQITPQPRRYFDPDKQAQLTRSVQIHGILEPLIVRPSDRQATKPYELIAGERRYRAAQAAGLTEVPVVIRDLSDSEALHISLIENLQRDDLNPLDETESLLHLLAIRLDRPVEEVPNLLYQMKNAAEKSGLSSLPIASLSVNDTPPSTARNNVIPKHITTNSEAIARDETTPSTSRNNVIPTLDAELAQTIQAIFDELGRMSWLSFTCNRLPLLNLDENILTALRQGKLAYTKAMAIARVKDESQRRSLLDAAIQEHLSLSQIRDRIRQQAVSPSSSATPSTTSSSARSATELQQRLKHLYTRGKRSPVWSDPAAQKKIARLLEQLESLL